MTKKTAALLTCVMIAFASFSCKNDTKETTSTAVETEAVSDTSSEKYTVNTTESLIEWQGFKPAGSHTGTLRLKDGEFQTTDGALTSGKFLIDMNSITVTDLAAGEGKEDLEAHLKGNIEGKEDHFFDVEKFPTAEFAITDSKKISENNYELSGNLAIRGVKHNISFPVTVNTSGDEIKIISDVFKIDRTKWNINYGSKSIFDNLGDKFINDQMELKVLLKAKKS